jgi:NADH-quinone oxidoreductase subunit N
MSRADLVALAPLVVVTVAALLVPLLVSVRRSHALATGTAFVGFVAATLALPWAASEAPRQVTPLLVVDGYALFYMGLIFLSSALVVLLAHGYLAPRDLERKEELYILLLLASLGSAVLVASSHFASFFLGLETLSVSLYALVAFARGRPATIEAGIKYLVLAAATSSVLLFGMALVYAELGVMEFAALGSALAAGAGGPVSLVGFVLMLVAVGFKLALAPFHMWAPDVYQGAPAPIAGYLATISKGGIVALLLRLLREYEGYPETALFGALVAMAIVSMLLGNLLALLQENVKRLLAYSSVAHMGYLLVALLATGSLAAEAVTFYLVAYFVTTLGAFGVIGALSRDGGEEADRIEDFRGLYWSRPVLAAVMTGSLLSLAGIPLTAGFIAKVTVLAAGVNAALWVLVLVLIIGSAIGVFYYLRVIVAMIQRPDDTTLPTAAGPALPLATGVGLAVLFVLLVWFGVYPAPVQALVEGAVAGLP